MDRQTADLKGKWFFMSTVRGVSLYDLCKSGARISH